MSCPFKAKDYQYVTVNATGEVGSIYFPNGRIRFVHKHGPQAVVQASVTRYLKKDHLQEILTSANMPKTFEEAKTKAAEKYALYEEYSHLGHTSARKHTSRGVPFTLSLLLDDTVLEAAYAQITGNAALAKIQNEKKEILTLEEQEVIRNANKAIYTLLTGKIPGIHSDFKAGGWKK